MLLFHIFYFFSSVFGFRPGFPLPVRVGFGAFSGIAHVVPNLTAPSIRPSLQSVCICRIETSHRFAVTSACS
jgi:hypothetical protein